MFNLSPRMVVSYLVLLSEFDSGLQMGILERTAHCCSRERDDLSVALTFSLLCSACIGSRTIVE
jgi:hypothetical protein